MLKPFTATYAITSETDPDLFWGGDAWVNSNERKVYSQAEAEAEVKRIKRHELYLGSCDRLNPVCTKIQEK